jgi:hypothetical protein
VTNLIMTTTMMMMMRPMTTAPRARCSLRWSCCVPVLCFFFVFHLRARMFFFCFFFFFFSPSCQRPYTVSSTVLPPSVMIRPLTHSYDRQCEAATVRPHVHVSVARGTDLCTERGHAILREARSPPRADGTVRICWPDAGLSFEAPGSASATATETLLAVVRTRLAGRFVVLSLHFSKKQNA